MLLVQLGLLEPVVLEQVELREVTCRRCGCIFFLCSSCDCGYWYCSEECTLLARTASVRRARRKYAHSDRGRANNLLRQRRFRRRNRLKTKTYTKTVTDHSSQDDDSGVSCAHDKPITKPRLHPRQGYFQGSNEVSHRKNGAICNLCGRPGKIIRQASARGRFRWFDGAGRQT